MNIKQLQAEVNRRIKRPDLVETANTRLIAVVRELHISDFYPRDRVEKTIKVANPTTLTKLTLPPYWRKFVCLAPQTEYQVPIALSKTLHQDFELVDVQDMHRDYSSINCYYTSFNAVTIKSEVPFQRLYACYFKYPDLRDLETTTWVTEHYEQLCVDYTLAGLFTAIGNKDLADIHRALASEALQTFRLNAEAEGIF